MRRMIVGVVAVVSLAVTIFIVGKVMNRPVKPDGVGRATGDVKTTFLNRKINFKSHSKTKGTDRKQSSQDVHDRASQIVVGRMGPWFESQTKLEGRVESETILRELAQDAEVVAVLKMSLLDLDLAMRYFGKDQAKARVLAIAVLRERALLGDLAPLVETVRGVVNVLGSSPGQKDIKGRGHDLADLLTAWIEAYGKDKFIQDPGTLLGEFSFGEVHRRELAMAALRIYPGHGQDQDFVSAFHKAWEKFGNRP